MSLSMESRSALFELVVHAVWADDRISPAEIPVARAAARVLHPDGEEGARGKLLLGPEMPLHDVARALPGRESALGFGLAAWVMLADGVELPRETAMLDRYRLLSGVPREVALSMRRAVSRARARRPGQLEEQLRCLIDEMLLVFAGRSDAPPSSRRAGPVSRTYSRVW
jgi:hypothetical protein